MESAGTHQGKRYYKVKRNGGLFRPPYVVTDIVTPPKKYTHKNAVVCMHSYTMSCILTPTHVNTHNIRLDSHLTKGNITSHLTKDTNYY